MSPVLNIENQDFEGENLESGHSAGQNMAIKINTEVFIVVGNQDKRNEVKLNEVKLNEVKQYFAGRHNNEEYIQQETLIISCKLRNVNILNKFKQMNLDLET